MRGRSAIAVSIATFALANEQNSIVHVLREAFGAQADRQNFGLEKWTAAVPAFDRPIGLLIMVA